MLLKPDLRQELAMALPLSVSNIGKTHTLSCNIAPGVFLQLTKGHTYTHHTNSLQVSLSFLQPVSL